MKKSPQKEVTDDDVHNGDSESNDEKVILERFRIDFEDVTDAVNGKIATLNGMVDKKLDLLQELAKVLGSYESLQVNTKTTTMMTTEATGVDEDLKSRKMKLSSIVNMLNNKVNPSFCNSFTGPYVWKGQNSAVFQAPHNLVITSCRLDCPIMKVG